jgi:hypothetical protein
VNDEPPHTFERHRDIPRSCVCDWLYSEKRQRWTRVSTEPGCPWHPAPVFDELAVKRIEHAFGAMPPARPGK